MRRFWVKRKSDDETVVNTYFGSHGEAQCVADALENETEEGKEYYVTPPKREDEEEEEEEEDTRLFRRTSGYGSL